MSVFEDGDITEVGSPNSREERVFIDPDYVQNESLKDSLDIEHHRFTSDGAVAENAVDVHKADTHKVFLGGIHGQERQSNEGTRVLAEFLREHSASGALQITPGTVITVIANCNHEGLKDRERKFNGTDLNRVFKVTPGDEANTKYQHQVNRIAEIIGIDVENYDPNNPQRLSNLSMTDNHSAEEDPVAAGTVLIDQPNPTETMKRVMDGIGKFANHDFAVLNGGEWRIKGGSASTQTFVSMHGGRESITLEPAGGHDDASVARDIFLANVTELVYAGMIKIDGLPEMGEEGTEQRREFEQQFRVYLKSLLQEYSDRLGPQKPGFDRHGQDITWATSPEEIKAWDPLNEEGWGPWEFETGLNHMETFVEKDQLLATRRKYLKNEDGSPQFDDEGAFIYSEDPSDIEVYQAPEDGYLVFPSDAGRFREEALSGKSHEEVYFDELEKEAKGETRTPFSSGRFIQVVPTVELTVVPDDHYVNNPYYDAVVAEMASSDLEDGPDA